MAFWSESVNASETIKADGVSICGLQTPSSQFRVGRDALIHWSSVRSILSIVVSSCLKVASKMKRSLLSGHGEVRSVYNNFGIAREFRRSM